MFFSLKRWTVVFRPKDPEDIEGIEKPIGMQVKKKTNCQIPTNMNDY